VPDDNTNAADLLAEYVELHNQAVSGTPGDMNALFVDQELIEVEGHVISALRREAMIMAFKSHELMLWKIGALSDDEAFADYAWRLNPRIGGVLRLVRFGDRISKLVLKPGYSRTFATLSLPPSPPLEEGGPNAFAGD
jgi:hypothetical protein